MPRDAKSINAYSETRFLSVPSAGSRGSTALAWLRRSISASAAIP
jgi:hypothetical protein